MTLLPGLSFATPWVLPLLAALPLLWRLLRVTPPGARRISFPAITLLLGLDGRREQAETTPPWLLALRLTLAALLIVAAAQPSFDAVTMARGNGPLLLVIDDGWAAARDWPARREQLDRLLAEAERSGQPVQALTTAPAADGGPVGLGRLAAAAEARQALAGLEPKPWAGDRRAALAALRTLGSDKAGRVVWLCDGTGQDGDAEFSRTLQGLGGGLDIITGRSGRLILPPDGDEPADRLSPRLRRLPAAEAESVAVRGLDGDGTVLARTEARFEAGMAETRAVLTLPPELRNRLVRLDIEGERGAGATLLLDESWRRRSVGLAGGEPGAAPLLDRLYYVERALAPFADLRRGEAGELLAEPAPEVLILSDLPLGAGDTAARVLARVEGGGVLIRFAGPLLAQAAGGTAPDPLLPVRLLGGGRALGGVLSWTAPMRLAPFPEGSPFRGLAIPDDVEVRAQVLAEPGLDLASHSWASLSDGTPLVTADRRGKGWVVLIHTTGNAEWSNLALSGLFVDMMRRLVALSQFHGPAAGPVAALTPALVLDGFGHLGPAGGLAAPLDATAERPAPGPRHPPGLYGPNDGRVAFNLGPAVPVPRRLVPPPGASVTALGSVRSGPDLVPALLVAALLLAITDMAATLALRGLLWRLGALVVLLGSGQTQAASLAMEATQTTRLACITTHEAVLDRTCLAGLRGLSARLAERSTAELGEPMLVDPERAPVLFFPILYWRITPGQPQPSANAVEKLNAYMARGGLIVFDTADEGQPGAGADTAELTRLRELVRGLALPPLAPLAPDHVLNRSFYLLKEVPGRWDGATIWLQQGASASNDGVSPVVLGGNDWVGAWAVDERGRPMHPVIPGGERQREMAIRFGINLVMYALTGNYKADQVHLPAIMERLRR